MTEPAMMKGIPGTRDEGRKRLVLIVEDDFVNREILKANLEAEYEILCAGAGDVALKMIVEHSETLSLVLLDLNLPGMKGLDLLREIK